MQRIEIAGCPLDALTKEEIILKLSNNILIREKCQVIGVNAAVLVEANKNKKYNDIIRSTTFLTADGYWVAFAANLLNYKTVTHIDIPRLVCDLLAHLSERGSKVYLLGAQEHIVKKAANKIEELYKGIRVIGFHHGYFSEFEEEEVLNDINKAKPDLVLVGMASPKKELWMTKYRNRLEATVIIGVGGFFDVLVGHVPFAPSWVKDIGLEWLFRLIHEPNRLWKRYLIGNAQFICLVIKDLIIRRLSAKGL